MKQGKDSSGWPPKPWTIARVWREAGEERTGRKEAGWWWQGQNLETGFTTCLYRDYDQCATIVHDYAHQRAIPWGV